MEAWKKWLAVAAGITAALVGVSAVVQAAREGSWSPLISVGWVFAVLVVTVPGASRGCRPGRRAGSAGSAGRAAE